MAKGRAMLVLTINADNISVTLQDNLCDIGLTLNVIAETLHALPPTELAWETAIMRIEDAISPLKPSLPKDELLKVIGAEDLRLLAFEQDDNGDYIRAEMLEKAFAVLAGYRSRDCKIFCVNLIIKHKFTQENINERFNRSFA